MEIIYNIVGEDLRENTNINIINLLSSKDIFMIDGIQIFKKDSCNWINYLSNYKKQLENVGILSHSEIESVVTPLLSKNYIYDESSFHAMHFNNKRLIYDCDIGLICEVCIAKKQVDVFRLGMPPVDLAKKARFTHSFLYTGDYLSTLKKLYQSGFVFNYWNEFWLDGYIMNGERLKTISHIEPIEKITLNKLINLSYNS